MRDFPMFTTEYGVASLILGEIPYRGEAYVIIQSSEDPQALLEECVSFARVCGAERIYARGHEVLQSYPIHCSVLEMRGLARVEPELAAHLWPVTTDNVSQWREIVNKRMREVDNARTLDRKAEKEIMELGGAYFVHDGGKLLGVGWIAQGELKVLAATEKGAGKRVLHTMFSLVEDQPLSIQVVSTNHRAIRLYEQAGFCTMAKVHDWYRVL